MIALPPYQITNQRFIKQPLQQTFDKVAVKIFNFSKLKKGWHYGEGEIVERPVINKALKVYYIASAHNLSYSTYALLNGGVSILAYNHDHFLEIFVNKDLSIDLNYEVGVGAKYRTVMEKYDANLNDLRTLLSKVKLANQKIRTVNNATCASLEYYLSQNITTAKRRNDLTQEYFQTHQIMEEFLLFTMNASPEEMSANISNNIIPITSKESRQSYIGSLTTTS